MSKEELQAVIQMSGYEAAPVEYHPAGGTNVTSLTHDGFNLKFTINQDHATIKPTAIIPYSITLGASADVIDLTAAEQALGRVVDLTDAKMFGLLFVAAEGNAGDITIKGGDAGDANPYLLFGTSGQVILGPGEFMAKGSQSQFNLPAVASGSRYLKFAGTENDIVEVLMFFGETPA